MVHPKKTTAPCGRRGGLFGWVINKIKPCLGTYFIIKPKTQMYEITELVHPY
jgi:hypothetical protein